MKRRPRSGAGCFLSSLQLPKAKVQILRICLQLPKPKVQDLPPVAEAESAEPANRLPVAESESADPAARWQLLGKCKTVRSLVEAVIRQKTDEQLHSISIKVVLDDVLAKANGKISMAELVQEKDAFIAATMAVVPQLLSAVKKPQLASGRPATIDSQCVQKTYLLTFSNLDPSSAPTRQTILDAVLKAFDIADYGSTAYITHAGVFREQHCSGQWHFHVATALSVPCRLAGWKRELAKAGYVAHFANMSIDDHSKHRNLQDACMLRYLWLPSEKKGLSALDKDPLLYCSGGRKHPPLLDAINGALDSAAIGEKVAERFLQRYAAGKQKPAKFADLELWPIVKHLGVQPDDPVLLARLLQHGRDSGNERLLNYLFANSGQIRQKVGMCCALETCDRAVAEAETNAWQRFTSALAQPCRCECVWASAAREILVNNGINEANLCEHVKSALFSSLQKKGDALCFAGSGNEGKSFILKPLSLIFPQAPGRLLQHHTFLAVRNQCQKRTSIHGKSCILFLQSNVVCFLYEQRFSCRRTNDGCIPNMATFRCLKRLA